MIKKKSKYLSEEDIQKVARELAVHPMTIPEMVLYMGYPVEVAYKVGATMILRIENAGIPLYEDGKKYGVLTPQLMDRYEAEKRKVFMEKMEE